MNSVNSFSEEEERYFCIQHDVTRFYDMTFFSESSALCLILVTKRRLAVFM